MEAFIQHTILSRPEVFYLIVDPIENCIFNPSCYKIATYFVYPQRTKRQWVARLCVNQQNFSVQNEIVACGESFGDEVFEVSHLGKENDCGHKAFHQHVK